MMTRVRFPRCASCGRYVERQPGYDCCRVCSHVLATRLPLQPTVGDGAYLNRMLTTGTDAPYTGPSMVRK